MHITQKCCISIKSVEKVPTIKKGGIGKKAACV